MKLRLNPDPLNLTLATITFVLFFLPGKHQYPYRPEKAIKNIVIVHGAFADGSGFEAIHQILTKKGYTVTIVQNSCTSLEEDVAATNIILNKQDGPTILVGHSWGGTVISQAGISPMVAGMVYIEGFLPEVGETTVQLASSEPPVPGSGALQPDESGWIYYPKAQYHSGFCGDLSKEQSDFMYDSQVPITLKCFTTPATVAAWKDKPTWGIVSTGDKSINPIILKNMYKRAGTTVTELDASHVVYISQPVKVAKVIESAAIGAASKAGTKD
ncbi:MAG: alpha/beta hydrolase [Chitinophagaceae bacterium]